MALGPVKLLDNSRSLATMVKSYSQAYPEERAMSDTFERMQAIIVDLLGVDPEQVTMDARFREDLEADSLDLVELIMAIEEEFGGEISDEQAQSITTVGEAVRYIDSQ
jgi:acyl carrier protein